MAVSFSMKTTGIKNLPVKMARASKAAQHTLLVQIGADTSKYVPFLTGVLDNSRKIEGDTLIYPGPYARYLYHGKVMVDPNAGSAFAPYGQTKVLTDRNLVFTQSFHKDAQAYWYEASKARNLNKWIRVAGKAVQRGI